MLNKLISIAILAALSIPALAGSLTIRNSYIPAAPPVVKVMAAYMQISNTSDKPVTVSAIKSDVFGHIEIHETTEKNGMMSMQLIPTLVIAAGKTIELKPGGKHLMLFRRTKNLSTGDKVVITLETSAGSVKTTAVVRDVSTGTHHHHHH